MGAYLPKPQTEKLSVDDSYDHVEFGVSGMQGWRVSMEDAHLCLPNVDGKGNCLFGVFDGHGGREVAEYCALNFNKFLLDTEAFAEGKIEKALKDTFLNIDEAITSDEVIEELKELGGINENKDEDVDEAAMLLEEAQMPLGELLERLKENVKEKLAESGLLKKESKEEVEEEKCNGNDEKPVVNGHTEKNEEKQPQKAGGRSRKQKKPVKRIEEEEEEEINESSADKNASGDAGGSGSSNSGGSGASGSSSIGGSGSGGSSKFALEQDAEDEDPDYEEGAKVEEEEETEEEGEEESGDEEYEDEESGDDDEEEDDDDDEFQDGEDVDFQQGAGDEVGKDSGTTAIVALIHDSKLYVANVGDSRCVLCRNGASVEMSLDHTPQNDIEKNRIEAAGGRITSDGRVNGGLNLSRAIGDHVYKTNKDLPPEAQVISAMPDIKETELTKDDSFMVIACDGIWNVMTSEEVVDFVKERLERADKKVKLSKICEELFDRCIAPDTNNDGSGCDNMTCLIVCFKHDEHGNIKASGQMKRTKVSDSDEDIESSSNMKSKKAKLS